MTSGTALVTGATGFLGGHLVRHLADVGWTVVALTRCSADTKTLDPRALEYRVDGTTETMVAILAESRPDVVVHLASLFVAEHTPDQVTQLIQSNVLFGAQLLEAMDSAGVDALVNVGTSWQHYQGAGYDPVCLYAATKQAFEDIVAYYVGARGLRALTLRLFDTYGSGDARPKLFHLLRQASERGVRIQMSPGEQMLDLVHVSDVARAFAVAIDRVCLLPESTCEAWAVSSGEPTRLRDVVELWQSVSGRTLDVDWGGRPYRAREVMEPWRGPALPGWTPQLTLAQGIAEMEAALRASDGRACGLGPE